MNPDPRGQVVVEVDTVGGTGPLGNGSGDYLKNVHRGRRIDLAMWVKVYNLSRV